MITDEYGLFELQTGLLAFVKKFDEFCRENNIQYTLHGGTLLGAIREKGFIPWDDDIDIGMTREQYQKIERLVSTNRAEEIYLDNKRDKIKKIWRNIEGQDKLWIDIFIYDYVSERKFAQKMKFAGLKILSAFSKSEIMMEAFRTNNRAGYVSKMLYEIIYRVGCLFSLERRVGLFDWFCEKAFIGSKKLIHRANDQLWAMPMIIPVESLQEFEYVAFEDTYLMISKDYNTILSQLYGTNYMTPKKVTEKAQKVHDITRSNA